MRTIHGDIWTLMKDHAICIPINLGWTNDGRNVMGRGLAAQASTRFPTIRRFVGAHLIEVNTRFHSGYRALSVNEDPPVFSTRFKGDSREEDVELVFVPSKKLGAQAHLSWQQTSDLKLIVKSLRKLAYMIKGDSFCKPRIAIPQIGAGNGRLSTELIRSNVERILGDLEEVTFVHYGYGRK